MRDALNKTIKNNPEINYRGINASRIDNLTDTVLGIAITLLIFNLVNPNSFNDLMTFTKTLPAFLVSISFLILIWSEHFRFSRIYALTDTGLIILNTLLIALIIFYVYPLRFLTLFLTDVFFNTDLGLSIEGYQVPLLMIYYGAAVFSLYFLLFLFYVRAYKMKEELNLNNYEIYYTKAQKNKLIIMLAVPLLSILLTILVNQYSYGMASAIGGFTYAIYAPAIIIWKRNFIKNAEKSIG